MKRRKQKMRAVMHRAATIPTLCRLSWNQHTAEKWERHIVRVTVPLRRDGLLSAKALDALLRENGVGVDGFADGVTLEYRSRA